MQKRRRIGRKKVIFSSSTVKSPTFMLIFCNTTANLVCATMNRDGHIYYLYSGVISYEIPFKIFLIASTRSFLPLELFK